MSAIAPAGRALAVAEPAPSESAAEPRAGFGRLQRRLFLLVLLGLLPLAVLSLVTLVQNSNRLHGQIVAASQATMQAMLTAIDTELATSAAALDALASSPRLAALDLAAFRHEAGELLQRRPGWANVVLSTPEAQQLVNLRQPPDAPLPRGLAPDVMQQVAATGRPVVGNLRFSPVLDRYGVPVSVPVRRDGRVTHVLTAVILPESLQALVAAQQIPPGAVVGIFDRAHAVVARSRNHAGWIGKPASPGLLALLERGDAGGWGTTVTLEGMPVYSVYHRSQRTGWVAAIGIPSETLDAPVRRAYVLLGGATLGSVLAGLLAAALIARTITRPMRELEQAAAAVGRGQAPPVPRTDLPEIRQVADALVAAHAERETLLASERESKVREQRARVVAENADRAKDEFLAILGHELRNPLAAISTASQLLDREPRPELARHANGIVRRQVQQLAKLTDDLMDAGRVVTGKLVLARAPMDLAACVAAVAETLRRTGPLRDHAVELALQPAWIEGDATRIEQIVSNLLVNAGKYTPAPGTVTVQVEREGGEAVLRVADTGLGLEPQQKEHIFDLFVQGRRGEDRAQGGLGIGLTLVRRLAELHGGRVEAFSEGPGRGSEFVLRLPAIEPAATAAREAAPPAAAAARTVVVVEDNADLRGALRELLEMEGHRVHEAADGVEGVRQVLAVQPDVALVDVGLPLMDGHALARAVRAQATRPVRLVAMTGYGHRDDLAAAAAAGFDACLVKPVDPAKLLRLLDEG